MGHATYDFDGETVVVTGGASGIGRAMAKRFGEAGATVVVADVRKRPKDVAGAACFLASEDAAYVTGEHLYVDGGWRVG